MSFPSTYREIRELVGRQALHTHNARAIMRKAGVRLGGGGVVGRAPLTIARYGRWTSVSPFAATSPIYYSRATFRGDVGGSSVNGFTAPIGLTSGPSDVAQGMTRFFLGGFTQIRAVAPMLQSASYLRLTIGMLKASEYDAQFLPGGTQISFARNARFPDSYERLTLHSGTIQNGGGGSPLTEITAPWTITEWVTINEEFLMDGEALCAIFARNINPVASGIFNTAKTSGVVELQVR